jgi:phosphoenolpyruvate carboxylase
LSNVKGNIDPNDFENEITKSTIESIQAIKVIQEKMVNLVPIDIISNNESALNVLETFAMIRLSDWEKPTVDVVPLFESVEDLLNAHNIMEQLYTNPMYANHLENREMKLLCLVSQMVQKMAVT